MADFFNSFWGVAVATVTIASIAGLICFAIVQSRGRRPPGAGTETMGHTWDGDLEEYNNPLPRWWLNLYYLSLAFGIGYLLLYPGLGAYQGYKHWSQNGQYEEEVKKARDTYGPLYDRFLHQDMKALAKDPEAHKIGARLFATYCTVCHGSDARGARGFPNLTDHDWLYGGEPEQIKESITTGRQGGMPPWGEVLKKEEIAEAAQYVLSFSGRQTDAGMASRGKEIFAKNCAVCHGQDAKGNPQIGAPNLTDDIWLYGGSKERIIESITFGRSGQMPAHKNFLDEAKIYLLAAYIYGLSNADGGK